MDQLQSTTDTTFEWPRLEEHKDELDPAANLASSMV